MKRSQVLKVNDTLTVDLETCMNGKNIKHVKGMRPRATFAAFGPKSLKDLNPESLFR
jgi:hypothetical protein